ncbi:apicoplast pyruvate carrier 1-like [Apostichopus japonicus]|uniref:apicoplast pyruvate carrier 1-like n=1 Tax=Stichopus japonicus TaxID=307972 RepID=UPI003AB7BB28
MAGSKSKGYITIIGGIMVHLTLGTFYCYGNMAPYVASYIREYSSPKTIRYQEMTFILAAMAVGQGAFIQVGGFLEKRIGPRAATMLGGLIMSSGVALSALTIKASFYWLMVTYGLVFGLGIGIAYVPPMVCANRWFPESKGLVNGAIAAGFGGGAFIFNIVQTFYINPDNIKPNHTLHFDDHIEKYYDQPSLLKRVPSCFLLQAGIFLLMQMIGVCLISNPPRPQQLRTLSVKSNLISDDEDDDSSSEEYHPTHFPRVPEEQIYQDPKSSGNIYTPLEVIRHWPFWILWFTFAVNAQIIVIVPSLYKAFGQTFIDSDQFLAVAGSVSSIFNAFGRIFWGQFADKASYKMAMCFLTTSGAVLLFTFGLTSLGGEVMYLFWVCAIFFTFSGNFALFPTVTARAFGMDHFGPNYGLLFTSITIASVAAAFLATTMQDTLGWIGLFQLVGGFSMVGLILTIGLNVKRLDGCNI